MGDIVNQAIGHVMLEWSCPYCGYVQLLNLKEMEDSANLRGWSTKATCSNFECKREYEVFSD